MSGQHPYIVHHPPCWGIPGWEKHTQGKGKTIAIESNVKNKRYRDYERPINLKRVNTSYARSFTHLEIEIADPESSG